MTSQDTLVRLHGIGKRFARNQRLSITYGCLDIAAEFLGRTPRPELRKGEFWALRDVSLSVSRGECVGVIGMNGAGKSTLLKVIAGIIDKDIGSLAISGRVVSLIEIGAGFHPLLTGRENVYLNGSILGMSKKEVSKQFDRIVEFSGIERFIDAPVRTYSSGMHVRLGFAVAAHSHPDILLLDEVLAVGDLVFTAKCMDFISRCKKEAAIIFVSHDMRMISRVCDRVLYLQSGVPAFMGAPAEAIQRLRVDCRYDGAAERHDGTEVKLISVALNGAPSFLEQHQDGIFRLTFECTSNVELVFNLAVHRDDGVHCFGVLSPSSRNYSPGEHEVEVRLPKVSLMPGHYTASAYIWDADRIRLHAAWTTALPFAVTGDETTQGVYRPEATWIL